MRSIALMFLLFGSSSLVAEDFIVVSGYGLGNELMDISEDCPRNFICPNSWFKYSIKVKRVISGKQLKGKVVAVKKQHATFIMDKKELAVFVLSEILDPGTRKELNANYYVHDFSRPKTIYCFNSKINDLGLKTEDEISYHPVGMGETRCINKDELYLE